MINNTFEQTGSCESDEWCTGPSDIENAKAYTDLCSKGEQGKFDIRRKVD